MYLPPHFAESRRDVLHAAIDAHPLSTLVSQTPREGGVDVEADHLPLLLRPDVGEFGALHGHVARGNPLWRAHPPTAEVLAVFHGPAAYVSPGAYPAKKEHGRVVPTWNYIVVHARGRLRVMDDAAWKRRLLTDLTARHEQREATPWVMSDAPAEYIQQMVMGVVGIEIEIRALIGKWKLSQNHGTENRAGVIAQLAARDDPAARELAARMRVRDYFVDLREQREHREQRIAREKRGEG